jgi:hypothetical protein
MIAALLFLIGAIASLFVCLGAPVEMWYLWIPALIICFLCCVGARAAINDL